MSQTTSRMCTLTALLPSGPGLTWKSWPRVFTTIRMPLCCCHTTTPSQGIAAYLGGKYIHIQAMIRSVILTWLSDPTAIEGIDATLLSPVLGTPQVVVPCKFAQGNTCTRLPGWVLMPYRCSCSNSLRVSCQRKSRVQTDICLHHGRQR